MPILKISTISERLQSGTRLPVTGGAVLEICKILVVIAIIALPLACFASGANSQASAIVVTKSDDGKEVTVAKGAIIEVRLEQSGGTGYLWQIVDPDQTHLKVLGSADSPLKQGRIVGGPMLKTWRIKAVQSGQTELKIFLYRSWEGIESAVDRLQVKILIR
jgi:predicted secreted protein